MTKEERIEKGMSLFTQGYNCAQAVTIAFEDKLDMPREQLAMLASSFGGGMGSLREVCGTVSGMFMVAGLLKGYAQPKDFSAKKAHYALIQLLAQKFKDENGSIICRDLLSGKVEIKDTPSERTQEYYKKRPCAQLVGQAVGIVCDNVL